MYVNQTELRFDGRSGGADLSICDVVLLMSVSKRPRSCFGTVFRRTYTCSQNGASSTLLDVVTYSTHGRERNQSPRVLWSDDQTGHIVKAQ